MPLIRCCSILVTWALKSAPITIARTQEITLGAREGSRSRRSEETRTAVAGVSVQCDARRRVVGMEADPLLLPEPERASLLFQPLIGGVVIYRKVSSIKSEMCRQQIG